MVKEECEIRYVLVTNPEMGQAVDLHSLLYKRVWRLQELFPRDDASIVHQNSNVTQLPFDLRSQATVIKIKRLVMSALGYGL